ncbi:MAG: adenosine deaminase [Chloroflexota bacterium]
MTELPKGELHLHLEGAIRPATALALAAENGADFPCQTLAEMDELLHYENFLGFLAAFQAINRCLVKPADFERIAYELGQDLAAQHVRYAEFRYAPMHPVRRGLAFDDVTQAVIDGAQAAMRDYPTLHMEIIAGYSRQFGVEACLESARQTARWAGRGVVAIDIGGEEAAWPAPLFRPVYDLARSAGLGLTAHAGEAAGPESVWAAVRDLGVKRIGHGVRSIEDADLVRFLRDQGVTLELCPTSNVMTGVVSGYDQHPLRRLYEAGVKVTLSSDDPALFRTSITHEYAVAHHELGFSEAELLELTRNSIQAGFCQADLKAQLLEAL